MHLCMYVNTYVCACAMLLYMWRLTMHALKLGRAQTAHYIMHTMYVCKYVCMYVRKVFFFKK